MATIQGTAGNVTLAGYNVKMSTWSATLNIEDVETTGFSDNGFATYEPVIVSLTGSAAGTAQYNASSTAPHPALASMIGADPVAVVLTAATGRTYSFNAVVSSVEMTRPHDGKMDVTLNFESSGAITQTWS